MVDRDILLAKTGAADKHLTRIRSVSEVSLERFRNDISIQDIVLFNIQLAIQNCIDIASHIIAEEGLGVPGSTTEMFYCLEKNGYVDRQLAEKMVKAVGFRNLIVHEYGKLDLERVYRISRQDIDDLDEFLKTIVKNSHL